MKLTATLACAIVAAVLIACSSTPATPPAPATYADRWQFPATVGKFQRGAVDYTGAGDTRQVTAAYKLNDTTTPIALTITVSRVSAAADQATAEQQFTQDKTAILKAHNVELVPQPSTAGSITSGGREHPGLVAKFTFVEPFNGKTADVDTHAYYFRDGDWAVRYRVMFPSAARPQAEAGVADFLSKLVWPQVQ